MKERPASERIPDVQRLLSLTLFFSLGCLLCGAEPPVQLLLPSRTLGPHSTFELRFPREMVPADAVGKPAAVSPLLLEPAVAGHFVWLSQRSGTFAPDGVLPLGTKFKISIRPGTKDAAGKSFPDALHETAETPPFQLKGNSAVGYINRDNATVVPRFLLLFNANVNAGAAAKYLHYVNAAGTTIAARVEQADDPQKRDQLFSPWQSDDRSLGIWGEDLPAPPVATDEDSGDSSSTSTEKTPPVRHNVLYVAPVKPLPPGDKWQLVLEPGLPAAELKLSLAAKKEIEIGVVQPFRVETLK
ncbi:MAG: hypothetical protein ABI992_09690, partial [Chthoniobacterales bacterium]